MAYTAWSVVFGEQPTAAKWNQLGANDAGFKDGTNIDNSAIIARHIAASAVESEALKNTVGYFATSAQSIPNGGGGTVISSVTEVYDTGSDASSGAFTAPYTGIYLVTGHFRWNNTNGRAIMWFNINSSPIYRFESYSASATADTGISGALPLYLTAGQTVTWQVLQETGGTAAPSEAQMGVTLMGRV